MKTFSAFKLKRDYSLTEKIEFGTATFLFLLGLIGILSEEPTEYGALFGVNYLYHFFILVSFYLSFLLLNFIVIPNIDERESLLMNMIIIAVIIAVSFAISPHLDDNALLIGLSIFFFAKFSSLFLWKRFRIFREERGSFSTGVLLAFIFYVLFMFGMFAGQAHPIAMAIPGVLIPFSIGLYIFSFHKLLPQTLQKKHPVRNYIWKLFLVVLASAIPLGVLVYGLTGDEDVPAVVAMLNFPLQFFITAPLTWLVYKRHTKGKEEVHQLQRELGQSTAKFDFLRSQINPHFLFNALNTLYGTAIQEKAERTGEGIQKLGDMMRFMLHENMQEKISLEREIEYLENYISLQRLRTDPNPDIVIQAQIQQQYGYAQISPMLLIPFVENAFKHGISFREPSHIKISLEKKENTLYFDVYNSKHPRLENDPEKDKNGIGLTNVKQRLQLLYPSTHELLIRENSKEFFVHLTLDLT